MRGHPCRRPSGPPPSEAGSEAQSSQRQPHTNRTPVALYLLDFPMANISRTLTRTRPVQTSPRTGHSRTSVTADGNSVAKKSFEKIGFNLPNNRVSIYRTTAFQFTRITISIQLSARDFQFTVILVFNLPRNLRKFQFTITPIYRVSIYRWRFQFTVQFANLT